MARPKKNEHTRDILLQKGIELLSENGFHGTGLKMILDTVKVPKGSFYNYFESKEKFAAEIIETYSRGLLKRLDQYLDKTREDPVTAIRSIYGVLLRELNAQGCQKGCLLGNLAAEIGGSSPLCQKAMKRSYHAWRQRFVKLIMSAQEKSLIRKDVSAEQLTQIFWNHWEGAVLRMKIEGSTSHAEESLNMLLDVLFR